FIVRPPDLQKFTRLTPRERRERWARARAPRTILYKLRPVFAINRSLDAISMGNVIFRAGYVLIGQSRQGIYRTCLAAIALPSSAQICESGGTRSRRRGLQTAHVAQASNLATPRVSRDVAIAPRASKRMRARAA